MEIGGLRHAYLGGWGVKNLWKHSYIILEGSLMKLNFQFVKSYFLVKNFNFTYLSYL